MEEKISKAKKLKSQRKAIELMRAFHKTYDLKRIEKRGGKVEYVSSNKQEGRKFLTRWEIWEAIKSKYNNMKHLNIEAPHRKWSWYVSREDLFNLMVEMKIHKSRHLTKKQKQKVFYELEHRELIKTLQKL